MDGVVAPVMQRAQVTQEAYEQVQEQAYEPTLVQPQEHLPDLSAKGAYLVQLLQLLLACDEQTVDAK